MLIRNLQVEDRETFIDMCRDFYDSGATKRAHDDKIANTTFDYLMSKHENINGFIAINEEYGKAIGYVLVTSYWCNEDGGSVLVLDELYISSEYRHKGYGKQMIQFIEKEYEYKVVLITLEVLTTNTTAKEVYSKLGYSSDGFEILTKSIHK